MTSSFLNPTVYNSRAKSSKHLISKYNPCPPINHLALISNSSVLDANISLISITMILLSLQNNYYTTRSSVAAIALSCPFGWTYYQNFNSRIPFKALYPRHSINRGKLVAHTLRFHTRVIHSFYLNHSQSKRVAYFSIELINCIQHSPEAAKKNPSKKPCGLRSRRNEN